LFPLYINLFHRFKMVIPLLKREEALLPIYFIPIRCRSVPESGDKLL
jgi:hypothetical protein